MKSFFSPGPSKDPGYINVRDSTTHPQFRKFVEQLWLRYRDLADPHFLEDAKNHFQERFWEMYLAVAFRERGFELVPGKGEGPEFSFVVGGKRVWVEAIAPGPGEGPDRVPELNYGAFAATPVPTEKILLRFTNALSEKRRKFAEARAKGIIAASDHYLLAINSRGIPHAPYGNTLPYFVQAVLPFGPLTASIDVESRKIVDSFYQYRDSVAKTNGSSVSTKPFLEAEYAFVSAILHSAVDCANHPSILGDDFSILHNPNAAHPLGEQLFSFCEQFYLYEKASSQELSLTLIRPRLNRPRFSRHSPSA